MRADEHDRSPQIGRDLELGAHPAQGRAELSGGHARGVADRLEEVDRESEVGAARRDLAGGGGAGDEVVVEDLDAVEPGGRDRGKVVEQATTDRQGREAGAHQAVSSLKCCDIRRASAGRPVKYSNAPTAWWTAIPPPGITRHPRARASVMSSVSSGK